MDCRLFQRARPYSHLPGALSGYPHECALAHSADAAFQALQALGECAGQPVGTGAGLDCGGSDGLLRHGSMGTGYPDAGVGCTAGPLFLAL